MNAANDRSRGQLNVKPLSSAVGTYRGDLPDELIFRNRVNSYLQKYSDLQNYKSMYGWPIPPDQEGRFAVVTNVGRDAMDVQAAVDERG